MAERSERREVDRSRVSLEEDYEVRYWTQTLRATKQEIIAAIAAVGNELHMVRRYVENYRAPPKRHDWRQSSVG